MGSGTPWLEGKCPSYTTAKCSSCNMTATSSGFSNMATTSAHLPVFHAKAKNSSSSNSGNNGKMATSDGRRKQISLLTHSVMMSPFHGEQPSHRQKAAGSGESSQPLPACGAHHPPSPRLNPRTQRGRHQLAVFNNGVSRSEVKANSVLLELDDLRSALRAQFSGATVALTGEMVEGPVSAGKEKEEQLQDRKDPDGNHRLSEEKVGIGSLRLPDAGEEPREDVHCSQEAGEETREGREDGSPLLEVGEEDQDVHKVWAAQTIQR